MKSGVWGYSAGYEDNRPIRAVGKINKSDFIKIVQEVDIDRCHSSYNWIRLRTGDTGNEIDIALAEKYQGQVVFYQDRKVLKVVGVSNDGIKGGNYNGEKVC